MKVSESCLVPMRQDIIVNGKRYGYVFKDPYYDWCDRKPRDRWMARMTMPEFVDPIPVFGFRHEEGATLEEAIRLAFEEFKKGEDLTPDEYAEIEMALFAEEDVLAEI